MDSASSSFVSQFAYLHVTPHEHEANLATLAAVIDNLTEGLLIADADGRLMAMNAEARRQYDVEGEAELPQLSTFGHLLELRTLQGALLEEADWPLQRVLRGERFTDLELEVRRKDTDSACFLSYSGTPLYRDGALTLAVVTMRDITARREAEQARAEQALWFRTLFEAVEDEVLVYHLTPEGAPDRLIEVNAGACRRLGYTREELLRMRVSEIVEPGSLNVPSALEQLRRQRRLVTESVHVARDGRHIPVEVSAVLFEHNGRPTVLSVCRDITGWKQAQQALRESEARYRTLTESVPQMMWVLRRDGTIEYFNTRWAEYTGRPATALDAGWLEVVHPDDRPRLLEVRTQSLAAAQEFELEVRLRRADGAYRWHLARVVPMLRDGELFSWLGTATDIDARKRAEEELRRLNETLEERVRERTEELLRSTQELARSNHVLQQRNRELQDFAYVASHDLQEPLRKVRTFADLLLEDYRERVDEQGQLYLERMQDAAARMSRLINELLAFSRVMTKGLPFQRLDLNEVLGGVVRSLAPRATELGGALEVDELPEIEADPHQMQQLMQHLLHNALKFRREDAPPVVRVRGWVEQRRLDGMPAAGDVCILEVEDNGIGFDERYLDKVFSPFQRLHGKSAYPGTGMGLAICRRIVERHGGEITARSTPGEGSTFVVLLPVEHGAPPQE